MPNLPDICAVVAAHNEAAAIANVLRQLHRAGVQQVVVVANGCRDGTPEVAQRAVRGLFPRGRVLEVRAALGPDVPRAYGTVCGLRSEPCPTWFLYVDGDWQGGFGPALESMLIDCADGQGGVWLTSASLQSDGVRQHRRTERMDLCLWRAALTRTASTIAHAAPSHAPMLVHHTVFSMVSCYWLHHPGLWLAYCCLAGEARIPVRVYDAWDGQVCGNPVRNRDHLRKMEETMIGDALDGCRLLLGHKPSRSWCGREYDGYHSVRRVDLLSEWLSQWSRAQCFV